MSHELEMVNGEAQMAWVGEVPWHGLGKQVPADLSPVQMLEAAGLNWDVKTVPAYADIDAYDEEGELITKRIQLPRSALLRSTDNKLLDVISNDWIPNSNLKAFEFFDDFVRAGDMQMNTAGSLKDGKIVWALAKINESFDLFGGDRVDSYLLFVNPHQYGQSITIQFTPIRVVCNNTLTLSLNTSVAKMLKVSHRNAFDGDAVKGTLGIARDKLGKYREMSAYLGSKRYTKDTLAQYFQQVFPRTGSKVEIDNDEATIKVIEAPSRNATRALEIVQTQPGAHFAEGSWWQAFNAVTYMTDHILGRDVDTRLQSAWFGLNKGLKTRALESAVEYANAA